VYREGRKDIRDLAGKVKEGGQEIRTWIFFLKNS
jgi:hypothetical protein